MLDGESTPAPGAFSDVPPPILDAPGDANPRQLMPRAERDTVIVNLLGLHARPAMQFVDLANQFRSQIIVRKDGPDPVEVDGKSVMQMITLEAIKGTPLRIQAEGDDAEKAVVELAALVESGFGEET